MGHLSRPFVLATATAATGLVTAMSLPGAQAGDRPSAPAAEAPATHVSAAPTSTHEVYAQHSDRRGRTTVVAFDPAPGVTTAELRDRLRGAGVPGVLSDDVAPAALQTSARPAAPAAPALWPAAGRYRRPQVHFLKLTPAQWPVKRLARVWNRASSIDSVYRSRTKGCPSGVGQHCVAVYAGTYGHTGWAGLYQWQGPDRVAIVKLNATYSTTRRQMENITCHEFGHALGLGHNPSMASCLYFRQGDARRPTAADYDALGRLYP